MASLPWRSLTKRFPSVPVDLEIEGPRRALRPGTALPCGDRPVVSVAFSRDGRRVAAAGGGMIPGPVGVYVFEVETGDRLVALHGHGMGVHDLAFSDDGFLATVSHDFSAVLWSIDDRDAIFLMGGVDADASRGACAFVGDALYVADGQTWGQPASLHAIDLAGGRVARACEFESPLMASALHVAGERLLVALGDYSCTVAELRWLDLEGAVSRRQQLTHGEYDVAPWLGGVAVVGPHDEPDDTRLWVYDDAGVLLAEHVLSAKIGGSLAVAPDGRRLAVGHRHGVDIRDAALDVEATWSLGEDVVASLAWSPEGRWIAAGTLRKTLRLYDLSSGTEPLTGEA